MGGAGAMSEAGAVGGTGASVRERYVTRSRRVVRRTVVLGVAVVLAAVVGPSASAQTGPYVDGIEPADQVAQGEAITITGDCMTSPVDAGVLAWLSREVPHDSGLSRRSTSASVPIPDGRRFELSVPIGADLLPGRYRVWVDCIDWDALRLAHEFTIEVTGTDPRPSFADLPEGYLHTEAIREMAHLGITHGCASDRFCPVDRVTRAQFASLLVRALDLELVDGPSPFLDVTDGAAHAAAIATLHAHGIANGCLPSRFCPSQLLRRDHAAALLYRALYPEGDDHRWTWLRYGDVRPDSPHFHAVATLSHYGVVRGCDDPRGLNRFCPGQTLTRAQAARLLHRGFGFGD